MLMEFQIIANYAGKINCAGALAVFDCRLPSMDQKVYFRSANGVDIVSLGFLILHRTQTMTYRFSGSFSLAALAAATLSLTSVPNVSAADMDARLPKAIARAVNFSTDVKPILERSCAQCHSGAKPKGKFSVESREAIIKGGDSKDAAIVLGQ
ncbi:MAG TPA: c-type cytochrome domain-containing protein, partial [Verrucomicrobiae bacterium]